MSNQTTTVNTGFQLFTNTDLNKIFIRGNRFNKRTYENSAYDAVTLRAGTVMGVVTATGWIKPEASGASDGSEIPRGVLAEDVIVAGGDRVELYMCVEGDIAQEQLIFQGSDNLDTTIDGVRMRDRLRDNAGVILVPTTNMSDFDNS